MIEHRRGRQASQSGGDKSRAVKEARKQPVKTRAGRAGLGGDPEPADTPVCLTARRKVSLMESMEAFGKKLMIDPQKAEQTKKQGKQ